MRFLDNKIVKFAIFSLALVAVLGFAGLSLLKSPQTAENSADLAVGDMANFVFGETGDVAPNISFKDGEGRDVTLAELRGKLILLNFWATWCAPCRREMGSLDRLESQLGGQKFVVVALSTDNQGLEVIAPFFEREKLRHLVKYNDATRKAQRAFRVLGLPTTFLIDTRGLVIGKITGPAEWDGEDAIRLVSHHLPKNQTDLPASN